MPKEGPFLAGLRRILGWLNRLTRGHMRRHGCGCALANAGHDTRAIQDQESLSRRKIFYFFVVDHVVKEDNTCFLD